MSIPFRILVADDEAVMREAISRILSKEGYMVHTAKGGVETLAEVAGNAYDVLFLDIRMPDQDGLSVLSALKQGEEHADLMVIMITGYPDIQDAVAAIKMGAFDYLPKPFTPDQLKLCLGKALDRKRLLFENEFLRHQLETLREETPLIGKSRVMQDIFNTILKVAPTDSTVLIVGPSGTGKELAARAIHHHSRRREREFVAVDCSALVETLLESELFGHVKGSFTGAVFTKHGLLELANGGTFLFDEISNLSLNIQAKLLRVIQEREFLKVGSEKRIKVDVRIIASTNQDLKEAIIQGAFREDLYYRLSVVPIYLPPLKERREDIPLLVEHFIRKFEKKRQSPLKGITPEALECLIHYDWPGNVRELEHTIERLSILEEKDEITLESLPWHLREEKTSLPPAPSTEPLPLHEVERKHILKVLEYTGGNRTQAARILGINRKTLTVKLRDF
jgi:DNA-binding NtrC family response regulator